MPRYYFDIHDGERLAVDHVGTELDDLSSARDEATRTLSEIGAEEIPRDGPHREFAIAVRDDSGNVLFELRLTFHTRSF
ncbi:DUF6894 family protein [Devosia sediminis]|uniref:DUF6894 domain-containing protein n=1 Tax=Devosia sediminis TaxID=2798801 RepID=A0A934IRJ4_9HYPH|nr:hypothetical protein [Devosia sediminis]MBJ3785498.1 hypothetical protein [Devosia sediminis]